MAGYFAKLSSLVSGGYSFPYNLGDAYSSSWGSWSHHEGTHKDTGATVSIFRVSSSNKDEPKMVAARNGVKRLRTVRLDLTLQCMPILSTCSEQHY
jgi:SCY1-like protein 1